MSLGTSTHLGWIALFNLNHRPYHGCPSTGPEKAELEAFLYMRLTASYRDVRLSATQSGKNEEGYSGIVRGNNRWALPMAGWSSGRP